MKNISDLFFILLVTLILLEACDDAFSPYGTFETKYSLNCIVRSDTNLQITTLYKSYAPNNETDSDNRKSSFIHNSIIRLWRGNDEIYLFKESSDENTNYYFTDKLNIQPGDQLEIEAILPDGNRLKSKTKVPDLVKKDYSRLTEIIPPKEGNTVTFAWQPNEETQVFVPVLYIYYKELIGNSFVTKKTEVPWMYVKEGGEEKGIHRPPLKSSVINFSLQNLERVLKSISEGKNKDNFIILSAILEIKVFDKNLSAYYLSVGKIIDSYSIRLDSQEFSNIEGGFGVFGSLHNQKIALLFDEDYLEIFGYKNRLLKR